MRYYDIRLAGGGGMYGSGWTSHPGGNVADPGAQEILMNLEVFNATDDAANSMAASPDSTIEIKGVSWEQIKHSNELVRQPVSVYGGMKPGLELATLQSRNAGQLVTGTISRTWGSWVGTEMSLGMSFIAVASHASMEGAGLSSGLTGSATAGTAAPSAGGTSATPSMLEAQTFRTNRTGFRSLDRRGFARGRSPSVSPHFDLGSIGTLVGGLGSLGSGTSSFGGIVSSLVGAGVPGLTQPLNLIHNMMENMPLSGAIAQTLSTAFPQLAAKIAISPMLKLNYQDAGVYQNIQQYAAYILNLSRSILGAKNYLGVHVAVDKNKAIIYDGTIPLASGTVDAIDLIGQPTWIDYNIIEVKVVMRSGFMIGGKITIPPGTLINFAGPGSVIQNNTQQRIHVTMEGITGTIIKINHIGDFRNPDGNYWCTVIRATTPPNVMTPSSIVPERTTGAFPSKKNVTIILPPGISVAPNIAPIITITPNPKGGPSIIREEFEPQNASQFGSVFKRSDRRH